MQHDTKNFTPNMTPAARAYPSFERIAILAILLVSFGLRTYNLDFQSFWSDEGISLLRSSAPLGEMLRDMPVEHMPGYFVLLHYWLQLTGEHDWGIRFLSLWPSVLAVALLFRLGVTLSQSVGASTNQPDGTETNRWFSIAAGLGGAILLATSAFQIWYAQEARMYSWLLATGLASHLFCWRLITDKAQPLQMSTGKGGDSLVFVGYVLTTTLSVYLHFYGFLVPLTQTVFVCGWVIATGKWQSCRRWVIAGICIFALFLPWLPKALGIFEFSGWRAEGDPWQIPQRYFAAYTVGDGLSQPIREWFLWVYLACAIIGIGGWLRERTAAGLFVLCGIGVPITAVIAFAINNPDFHERYSIIVSGFIALAVGGSMGLVSRQQWYGWIGALILTGALLVGNGLSLQRQATDSLLHKPDFRSAALHIAQNEQAGDVILVDGPDPEKVFLHYYEGISPVHDLRSLEDESWETVSRTLQAATNGHSRIWELLYFHGPGLVQTWTATNGWATDPTYHNNIRVTLYGAAADAATPSMESLSHDIAFGSGLTLLRSEINGTFFSPGDLIRISTVWHVHEQLPDYKFSLRLLKEDGMIIDTWDYIPQNWIAPTTMWIVESQATDQHGILLPTDLPPGNYHITIRLYDPINGVAVDTEAGQDVLLREIQVEP